MTLPKPSIDLIRVETPGSPLCLGPLDAEDARLLDGSLCFAPDRPGLIPLGVELSGLPLIRAISRAAVLGLPLVVRTDLPVRALAGNIREPKGGECGMGSAGPQA